MDAASLIATGADDFMTKAQLAGERGHSRSGLDHELDGQGTLDNACSATSGHIQVQMSRAGTDDIGSARQYEAPPLLQGQLEIRPIQELDQLGEAFTPELREQEEQLRARIEGQQQ